MARGRAKVSGPAFLAEIQKDLTKSQDPERRAACALALGFLSLPTTGPALGDALKKETDPLVQGALALGLGLGREKAAAKDLAALFFRSKDSFPVKAAALALAAMGVRQDPPQVFWDEGKKGGGPDWAWKVQWLGWFGGEGTLSGMEALLAQAPARPEGVTGALRALRIMATPRKDAPAARLFLAPSFPMEVKALEEARVLLWGKE